MTSPRLTPSSNLVRTFDPPFISRLRKQVSPCPPSAHISQPLHPLGTSTSASSYAKSPDYRPPPPAEQSLLAFCSPRQQAHFIPASPILNYNHLLTPWLQLDCEVLQTGIISYSSLYHKNLNPIWQVDTVNIH